MSAIQNKAVALVKQNEIDFDLQLLPERRLPFLRQVLELYFTMGGDPALVANLVNEVRFSPRVKMDDAVAGVMIELAAVSHLCDIDMVQATYNRLDAELVTRRR